MQKLTTEFRFWKIRHKKGWDCFKAVFYFYGFLFVLATLASIDPIIARWS